MTETDFCFLFDNLISTIITSGSGDSTIPNFPPLSTIKERFNLLNEIVKELSKNNKLNLMIYDGDLTYIHSNMRNSLYYLKNEEGFLVATTPLSDDENWKPVELNKLFGLIDGNIIFESEEHDNEFIQTEEHEKALENFLNSLQE